MPTFGSSRAPRPIITICNRSIWPTQWPRTGREYRSLSLAEPNAAQRFELAKHEGAIFLDQLRHDMGDDRFFKLMADFFTAHTARSRHRAVVPGCRGREIRDAARSGRPDVSGLRYRQALAHGDAGVRNHVRRGRESLRRRTAAKDDFWIASKAKCRSGKTSKSPTKSCARTTSFSLAVRRANSALAAWKDKIGLRHGRRPLPHRRQGARF